MSWAVVDGKSGVNRNGEPSTGEIYASSLSKRSVVVGNVVNHGSRFHLYLFLRATALHPSWSIQLSTFEAMLDYYSTDIAIALPLLPSAYLTGWPAASLRMRCYALLRMLEGLPEAGVICNRCLGSPLQVLYIY